MTNNLNRRQKDLGFTEYDVLETHTCIYEGSRREIELQKQYGYPVDPIPYYKLISIKNSEVCAKGGVATGRINRNLTFEQATEIRAKYKQGIIQKDLANEYGVSKHVIYNIIHNKSYLTP